MNEVYFVWCDPDKKYKQQDKLEDAIYAYERKWKCKATEVLVHESDLNLKADIPLRTASFVPKNNFYIPQAAGAMQKSRSRS